MRLTNTPDYVSFLLASGRVLSNPDSEESAFIEFSESPGTLPALYIEVEAETNPDGVAETLLDSLRAAGVYGVAFADSGPGIERPTVYRVEPFTGKAEPLTEDNRTVPFPDLSPDLRARYSAALETLDRIAFRPESPEDVERFTRLASKLSDVLAAEGY